MLFTTEQQYHLSCDSCGHTWWDLQAFPSYCPYCKTNRTPKVLREILTKRYTEKVQSESMAEMVTGGRDGMNGCVYRGADNTCLKFTDGKYYSVCVGDVTECEHRKMSNADRIRAMSDEELAGFLDEFGCALMPKDNCVKYRCIDCFLKWLKQEVTS